MERNVRLPTLRRRTGGLVRRLVQLGERWCAVLDPAEIPEHEIRVEWGDDDHVLVFGDLVLDLRTHEARRAGRTIELTRTEFRLLELFLRNPRQVLTRELIFDRVWGFDFGPTSNTLSVYVGYLRRKLEVGGGRRLIHTVRGVGYMLRE
jgi:two-component system response regulator MprA